VTRQARRRGKALRLGLLLLLPAQLSAQAVVEGRVFDARTGSPLAGVDVQATNSNLRTNTDALGRYRLVGLSPGAQAVEARLAGFQPEERAVVAPAAGVVRLDFSLFAAPVRVPQVDVIGPAAGALKRIPGSAAVVTQTELAARVALTGNEVLRTLPGIHVQDEEGMGLRANIGIRGLDPDRSRSVLVLEDGVPVALAPYGEPEMYYTPPIDRMARVEVVKGSGSILFGPQTLGGVINFVTPSPPPRPAASLDVRGGSGGFFHGEARYGGTWSGVGTHVGVLRKQVDDLNGHLFTMTDLTGKLAVSMGDRSELGVKLSVYDEESNSTYVGLTEAMFAEDPRQHPAPTDRLWVRRYAASATHELVVSDRVILRTTAYGSTVSRDWMRQDYNSGDTQRTRIELRGTTGNRNRSFDVAGLEPRLQANYWLGMLRNELDAGLRLHYEQATETRINGSTPTSRSGTLREHEIRSGQAGSAYLQNRFFLSDAFFLTPGVRWESFSFERHVLRRADADTDLVSNDVVREVIPGLGASWLPSDRLTLFAGAHRGFAPPRVKDALVVRSSAAGEAELVSLELEAERSWNYELGVRGAPVPALQLEATGFLLDFSNQIIAPSLSAGSVAQAELANQGETRHVGVESGVSIDWGEVAGLPFGLRTHLKHTYVRATFAADRFMERPTGDTVNVRGNRLPYAPAQLLAAGLALDLPSRLRLRADGVYTGEHFADNFETVATRPDGRVGLIPARTVWNMAGTYELPRRGMELFASVKNVLNTTYVASRRPEGIKPGLPRTINAGVRVTF
jgi:Fe(3+) dicitrate transport protein